MRSFKARLPLLRPSSLLSFCSTFMRPRSREALVAWCSGRGQAGGGAGAVMRGMRGCSCAMCYLLLATSYN